MRVQQKSKQTEPEPMSSPINYLASLPCSNETIFVHSDFFASALSSCKFQILNGLYYIYTKGERQTRGKGGQK